MPECYFGIDFGTTNSAVVAILEEHGVRRILPVRDGTLNPIPSVVRYFGRDKEIGSSVRQQLLTHRGSGRNIVVESVKTAIESEGDYGGHTPVQVASDLLAYLSECARKDFAVKSPIERAVFAIPVNWSSKKRRLLSEAARRAHIEVAGLVSEPTAALLAMHGDFRSRKYITVFDWGGGTLDVAVLERRRHGWREIGTKRLDRAGDEVDYLVASYLLRAISAEIGRELSYDNDLTAGCRQGLKTRAEEIKRNLQRADVTSEIVDLFELETLRGETIPVPIVEITRAHFDSLVAPVLDDALLCLDDAVRSSGISSLQIDALLVIGGSSQLAALQERLQTRFEAGADRWEIWYGPAEAQDDATTTPPWLVARGAALLARAGGRCARLAHDVGLLVADAEEPFFEIMKAGERASALGGGREFAFGLVEEATTATFIVAARTDTNRPRRLGAVGLQVQGFADELLHFNLSIDTHDLLLAKAKSEKLPLEPSESEFESVHWEYDLDSAEVMAFE